MSYEELLKRALKSIPAKTESRFEIPVASVHVEKRQTIIRNFADIAKSLRREPSDISKYLFKALAVPGGPRGNELVLQAKVPPSLINQRIKEYVKDYVICDQCGKPDTHFQKVDNYMLIKCEACGAKRTARRV